MFIWEEKESVVREDERAKESLEENERNGEDSS
jgi:hypothetical protein